MDLAIVNGEEDKDTNSMKGVIARLGVEGKNLVFGISLKQQDGIGSENQKTHKNHYGIDFMLRNSSLIFSGEVIYDEYGFRKFFNEDEIFWPRSLYHRDTFYKFKTPIVGIGGYIDLGYRKENLFFNLNYGEYYPKKIGKPLHDDPIKRSTIKLAYNLASKLQLFVIGLLEHKRKTEDWQSAKTSVLLIGFQYKIF